MPKSASIAEARKNLPSLVHEVEEGVSVELTRRGRPVAVLLSRAEYERLTRGRTDLWESIRQFRQQADLSELEIEEIYEDVRDRSPGREPEL